MEPLMEAKKENAKRKRKEKKIFILDQGCIENPVKNR